MTKPREHSITKIILWLSILGLTLQFSTLNQFRSPKMRISIMQRFFRNYKKDHEHCSVYSTKDFEFPKYKIDSGFRKLNKSLIKKYLLSEDKYFPAGNYDQGGVHSIASKLIISFVLLMILLTILLITLLLPCPFWSKSWIRVLKDPYNVHSLVGSEDDSIRDKQRMVKLQKTLNSWTFFWIAVKLKMACIVFMISFFAFVIAVLNTNKFGEKSECGLVVSIFDFFEGNNTKFFKEFGVVKPKNILDTFLEELEDYHKEIEGHADIMKNDFGADSRVIQASFKQFYNKYKDFKVRACTGNDTHLEKTPFQTWNLHNPDYLSGQMELEVKEIVKFGTHIHKAAINLRDMRANKSDHLRRFKISLDRFKQHLLMMNQNFFNYYDGVLQSYKKMIARTRSCCLVIGVSFLFYVISIAVPKRVLRIQIFLGLLCSIFLMWNGLKLYSEVLYRTKGCLAAHEIIRSKFVLHDYLVPKTSPSDYSNSLFDWSENCFVDKADGDIENVIKGRKKKELDYGLSILRGLSHDLKFLNKSDVEPREFYRFANALDSMKMFERPRRRFGFMPDFGSPHSTLDSLNWLIKCTKNYFVFFEKDCKKTSKVFEKGESLMENLGEDYCIPVMKYEHLVISLRYKDTCVEEKYIKRIQKLYKGLRTCIKDHDQLSDLMIRDFGRLRKHVKKYLEKFRKIESDYRSNRAKFNKTIGYLEEEGTTLTEIMNCKSMKPSLRMALGNACYRKFSVVQPFISAAFVLLSGLILLLITMLRLAEVVRFWAKKGDSGMGIELGGV